MFVTTTKLNRLVEKFEKWADEFEKTASAKGIDTAVYQHYTGNARAYRNAAQELRKLVKEG